MQRSDDPRQSKTLRVVKRTHERVSQQHKVSRTLSGPKEVTVEDRFDEPAAQALWTVLHQLKARYEQLVVVLELEPLAREQTQKKLMAVSETINAISAINQKARYEQLLVAPLALEQTQETLTSVSNIITGINAFGRIHGISLDDPQDVLVAASKVLLKNEDFTKRVSRPGISAVAYAGLGMIGGTLSQANTGESALEAALKACEKARKKTKKAQNEGDKEMSSQDMQGPDRVGPGVHVVTMRTVGEDKNASTPKAPRSLAGLHRYASQDDELKQLQGGPTELFEARRAVCTVLAELSARYHGIASCLQDADKLDTQKKEELINNTWFNIVNSDSDPVVALRALLENKEFTKRVKRPGFQYSQERMIQGTLFQPSTGKAAVEKALKAYEKAVKNYDKEHPGDDLSSTPQ